MALQWGQQCVCVCVMWVMMRGGVLTVPFPVRDTLHVWNIAHTHTFSPSLCSSYFLSSLNLSSTMSTELNLISFYFVLAGTCHFVPLPQREISAKTPRLFSSLKTVRLMHQQVKRLTHSDTIPFVKKMLDMERPRRICSHGTQQMSFKIFYTSFHPLHGH